MRIGLLGAVFGATLAVSMPAGAQSPANLRAIEGLVPLSTMLGTENGRIALAANLAITGAIQSGELRLPALQPFADQRRQAVRDAFITNGNAANVADALGTKLGAAYLGLADYSDPKHYTSVSQAVGTFINYTNATTGSDSNAGKYFFANGTTDGSTPASVPAAEILARAGGVVDVLGKAYGKPAGSPGADPFGNSRPFQTLAKLVRFDGPDYFGKEINNLAVLAGPETDLTDSPSFPSGHTTYGTQASLVLALLLPERFEALMARGAEYGLSRIVLGAHYTVDVVAGRALALHDVAHLLANDPQYVGPTKAGVTVTDYPAALRAARTELRAALEKACGATIAVCAADDTSRFADAGARRALLDATATYGLPAPATGVARLDYATVAPEAANLLTAAFPDLPPSEALAMLGATQRAEGTFLEGTALGPYARLDLAAAARLAAAWKK